MNTTLQQFIAETGFTQSAIAQALGRSPAVINQYLQGKYKGDCQAIDKAVEQFINRHSARKQEVRLAFVATPSANAILEVCALAHTMFDIQLVIGEAGLGKTMALKHYTANHSGVIMLEVEPTYNVKVLLNALCIQLNLSTGRSNHDMMTAVIDKLDGSEQLLIIDEAELLPYKALEILRRIHDKAGIGLLLAGLPRLRANLRGSRGQYKQLYSRVGLCHDLRDKLKPADIHALCQSMLGTDQFNQALYKASGGNARRLAKLVRGIARMSKLNQAPIDQDMITRFAQMLID